MNAVPPQNRYLMNCLAEGGSWERSARTAKRDCREKGRESSRERLFSHSLFGEGCNLYASGSCPLAESLMTRPAPGQRWMTRSDPKMGLGVVIEVEGAQVVVLFPAAEETRRYALQTAPLVRVLFKEGDEIEDQEGTKYRVCLLYTSPSPRDLSTSRMPSSA